MNEKKIDYMTSQDYKEQKKLELLMEQDEMTADIYKQNYSNIKESMEIEEKELRDIHKDFDYYNNEEMMANKLGTDWYDPKELDFANDIHYSTEFTSDTDEQMYKRYKMMQFKVKERAKDYQEMLRDMSRDVEIWEGKPMNDDNYEADLDNDGDRNRQDNEALFAKAQERKKSAMVHAKEIETKMAMMK